MDLKSFYESGGDYFLPNLSVDIVIIGYHEGMLKGLLLKIGDKWLLPGGYIQRQESVDGAATRILKERTGLEDPHLKFLSVFGSEGRRFTRQWKAFAEKAGLPWKDDYWINDRFVTLAYYSLVHIEEIRPVAGAFDEAIAWFPLDDLPAMWMDHQAIVLQARSRLKEDIRHEQVTFNLLPDTFTMPELHRLHQAILEEPLDRSRFQKKMLATGLFERLPKRQKESPGRNPYQYRVKGETTSNRPAGQPTGTTP